VSYGYGCTRAARYVFDRLWTRSSSEPVEDVWEEMWAEDPNVVFVLGAYEPARGQGPFAYTFDDLDSRTQQAIEPVYQNFYNDVGAAKDALRAQ
jgi:hypothetical protein